MAKKEYKSFFTQHEEELLKIFPQLKIIVEKIEKQPQLAHASNIVTKAYKLYEKPAQAHIKLLNSVIENYLSYLAAIESIHTYEDDDLKNRAIILDGYYRFFEDSHIESTFDSRSKIRSTILEEFTYLFLKDKVDSIITAKCGAGVNDIKCGAVDAYSNLYITGKDISSFASEPLVRINGKDQDYAIYCTFQILIPGKNGKSKKVIANVPILAIENKTFLDKTMLDGAIATAEKLKSGNPYSAFIVITETYAVAEDVDPIYSRIDQIFVLRKCKHDKSNRMPQPIDSGVLKKILEFVSKHLSSTWSDVSNRVLSDGVVMESL